MVVVLRPVLVRVNAPHTGGGWWQRGWLLAESEGYATVTTPAATRQYEPGRWKEAPSAV